jgi:hypothetical protein
MGPTSVCLRTFGFISNINQRSLIGRKRLQELCKDGFILPNTICALKKDSLLDYYRLFFL